MALDPSLGIKMVYLLGIANVGSIILVYLSCRCLLGTKLANKLWQYEWYKKFYAKHSLFWKIFVSSVLLHTILAFFVFGNPFF